ncbi:MAG: GGDEF domain-containing protein [Deltaproteobacteria bacterium]|nr:MAG: GGDEF domain-containing protein [Deltaproteobacteria bacterium]
MANPKIDLEALIERIRQNEITATKFDLLESNILNILNFKDFFQTLLDEVNTIFGIPYVWISLIRGTEASALIYEALKGSDILSDRLNFIQESEFIGLLGPSPNAALFNSVLRPLFKLFPGEHRFIIKSIAIVPLFLDGKRVGSLNLADPTATRYEPGIDTSLLDQLGVKLSLCLSNVTAHEKLSHMASRDPLTRLLNRRVMGSILDREWERSRRYLTPLSIMFVDVNDFKMINDTHGHNAGDEVLTYIAATLDEMSRENDVACRFAGDEFVVILPGIDTDSAENLARRISEHLAAHPYENDSLRIPVSISFGVASSTQPGIETTDQLLKAADQQLYVQKKKKS